MTLKFSFLWLFLFIYSLSLCVCVCVITGCNHKVESRKIIFYPKGEREKTFNIFFWSVTNLRVRFYFILKTQNPTHPFPLTGCSYSFSFVVFSPPLFGLEMIYPRTHVGCFLFFSFLFPLQLLCVGVKRPPPQERKKHISFFFFFLSIENHHNYFYYVVRT